MRLIKSSNRHRARLSLVFLDWSVRESFHILHYLRDQTAARDSFEVIFVEYYGRESTALHQFEDQVDTWVLLEMPDACYYHKHLMYNAGIVLSQGDIVLFGDSDAMVRTTFIETILRQFDRDPLIVYHMDQFRNVRRDLYPFRYPSFEEVLGEGCINNAGGKTAGIVENYDRTHARNYGACMCARREDLIAIGGADEDMTYVGHICGPYDMTFRLMNAGRRLIWETEEYMYHTWHPGSDGVDNYLGPHDGLNMSTTAFDALCQGRVAPLVTNAAIHRLQCDSHVPSRELPALLIDPSYPELLRKPPQISLQKPRASPPQELYASYRGYDIYCIGVQFYGVPAQMGAMDIHTLGWRDDGAVIKARAFSGIKEQIDHWDARQVGAVAAGSVYRVGGRVAIVPWDLQPPAFQDPSWRTHHGIVWAEDLHAIRKAFGPVYPVEGSWEYGNRSRVLMDKMDEQMRRELAALREKTEKLEGLASNAAAVAALRNEVAKLGARIRLLEDRITGIYTSRTWRTLTRLGGFIAGRGARSN